MSLQISRVESNARTNSGTENVTPSLVAFPPRHIYRSFLQSFILNFLLCCISDFKLENCTCDTAKATEHLSEEWRERRHGFDGSRVSSSSSTQVSSGTMDSNLLFF